MAKLPELLVQWEYCKVETFVTDWSGFNGPKGITLRSTTKPPRDFDSVDQALKQMGLDGWECFFIEKSPPPIISFATVIMRFKRPIVEAM